MVSFPFPFVLACMIFPHLLCSALGQSCLGVNCLLQCFWGSSAWWWCSPIKSCIRPIFMMICDLVPDCSTFVASFVIQNTMIGENRFNQFPSLKSRRTFCNLQLWLWFLMWMAHPHRPQSISHRDLFVCELDSLAFVVGQPPPVGKKICCCTDAAGTTFLAR